MAEVVLSVSHLKKNMGGRTVIHDMTFDVRAGEVFGFLGPNGAGKTTTIRMLVGLIAPDGGDIRIGGWSLRRDFCRAIRQVGCIVENPELYKFMTGRENLEHFARMSGDVPPERIREVAEFVELAHVLDHKVKTYSLGMRQRLGIAQALLHKPKLLILDEPTNGLDPAGIRELRGFIRRLADEEGLAVFVSSHLLSEVEMMCDRVAIIDKGRVISVGGVKELMETFADQVEWRFLPADEHRGRDLLASLPYVREAQPADEGRVLCRMDADRIGDANQALVAAGVRVIGIAPKTATLEDLFLSVTGGAHGA